MSKFFIRRPIVAMVIAILTVIVGIVSMLTLPTAQYPDIVPPEIMVQATYPGADAKTLTEAVATPIEQQMNGVDHMLYMNSISANNGQATLYVDFDLKTNPDTDQVLSQIRVSQAQAQLPPEVNTSGLVVQKSLTSPLMVVAVSSPDRRFDVNFLTNYAIINIQDELARIPGVARIQVFGGQYALRVWVKPDQLAKLGVTATDVINAIQVQNNVNPAGQVGGEPVPNGQQFTYTVRTQGRLVTPEQFGNIVIRANPDGSVLHLRDVARVELGTQTYDLTARLNNAPAGVMAVYSLPGSNAVQTAAAVTKRMQQLSANFPPGVRFEIPLDTTKAVTAGIHEIVFTLVLALLLVILVVFLFLQRWRSTLIPLMAVPVSLIGTFMVFPLLGFSINTLSLFGLVLAIGLVVDDAIIVVEAVEHHIEQGLSPRDASFRAMEEISGPLVAIALVLSAVFIPTAAIPGITGRLYQQFAVTIAISVIISAFNALTLSPALAALLLKPKSDQRQPGPLGKFFAWFNRYYDRATDDYVSTAGVLIHKSGFAMLALAAAAGLAFLISGHLPSGFLPQEDQGYLFVGLQLPDAASLQRTDATAQRITNALLETPGVQSVIGADGYNLLTQTESSNTAFFFVTLKPWDARKSRAEQIGAIQASVQKKLAGVSEGLAFSFPPPAILGIGTSGGVTMILQDRSGNDDPTFLAKNVFGFLGTISKRPEIAAAFPSYLPAVPQLYAEVDRDKAAQQQVDLTSIYTTMQTFMGGYLVNYFNRFGRQWQTFVQAEGDTRTNIQDINQFYVRSANGSQVPLGSLVHVNQITGPEFILRFNEYNGAQLNITGAPGYSSGQVRAALEDAFHQTMPPGMGFSYEGMSFQEQRAAEGVPAWMVFGLSLLCVFLILAALYESWSLPFSILLSTPMAVLGAFAALWLRRWVTGLYLPAYTIGIENDVYSQIGLVVLIGLAAKNSILIVAFAKADYEKGKPLVQSALDAARLRFRPLMMTSLAFILGCVPLWMASGAGAVSRQVMGTAVIGGMVVETFLGRFLIPAIFTVVEKLSGAKVPAAGLTPSPEAHGGQA
jgi:hydrophobic/amphiphilic exporter-1 (mainly G- bacteria), HAE1 family